MPFTDEHARNAHEFTKKLAFPRLVGSEGEKKAQQLIDDELKVINNPYNSEDLKCSQFVINIVFRYVLPIGALILLMAWLFNEPLLGLNYAIISLSFASLGLAWFILSSSIINMSFGRVPNFGKIYKTKNYVSEIKPSDPRGSLIFLAHYDSKSQFYPGIVRVILFIGGIITGILYSVRVIGSSLILLIGGVPSGFWLPGVASFLIAFVFNVLLALNSVGNRSPGALDDATGVAIVLELLKIFKQEPPQHIKLTFLITAAEELGLYGAYDFVKRRKSHLDPRTTFFLNYDGIGSKGKTILLSSYGIPPKKTSKILNNLIEEIVIENNFQDSFGKLFLPIGAASDHVPIQRAGFEVTLLGSFISNFHTSKDTIDNIDEDSIRINGIIGYELVKKLEQKLKEKSSIII